MADAPTEEEEAAMAFESYAYGTDGSKAVFRAPVRTQPQATICTAHAISEGGKLVLGAQAGEARLSEVFRKAGFTHFRRAASRRGSRLRDAPL